MNFSATNHDERHVFDTNVVVSAFVFPQSVSARALSLALRRGKVLASQETLTELEEVLRRDKFDRWSSRSARQSAYISYLTAVTPVDVQQHINACVDPKDNKFLSLAVDGKASFLISGDDHLRRLNPFQGISIIRPDQYLKDLGADVQ